MLSVRGMYPIGEVKWSPMKDYCEFFHHVVMTGIVCGLRHPVEWVINAHRVPGGALTADYYQWVEKYIPQFLSEIYKATFFREPSSARDVLDMCDAHYPDGHLCKGYFNFLEEKIDEYIKTGRC